jgi:hypothetical protein
MTDISFNTEEKIRQILQGSVDFHVHAHMSQDFEWNLVEIGTQATSIGMRAIVIKNLYGSSHEQCNMANKILGKDIFYATLVLGRVTGGINATAVKQFALSGATNLIVEMPVFDAAHHLLSSNEHADPGINVIKNGEPSPGVIDVLDVVYQNNLVLKTGHISPQESIALIKIAKDIGVKQVVVTHATGAPVIASVEQQMEMVTMGAVIEHCLVKFLPDNVWKHSKRLVRCSSEPKLGDLEYLKESIRNIGADHCLISTDSGLLCGLSPHEQFKYFIYLLLTMGFSVEDVRTMAKDNPRKILGIVN